MRALVNPKDLFLTLEVVAVVFMIFMGLSTYMVFAVFVTFVASAFRASSRLSFGIDLNQIVRRVSSLDWFLATYGPPYSVAHAYPQSDT